METRKQITFTMTTIALFAAGVIAFVVWGGYTYLFHQVSLTGQEDARLAAESDKLDREQSEVLDLKRDLSKNQARQPVLASYFVDATDPVPLFETLESYGRMTNVMVEINSVDVKRQPDRLMVSVTGHGTFTDTYRFLALLEAAPYEFTFTNMSLKVLPVARDADGKIPKNSVVQWESHSTMSITSVTGAANVPVQK